LLEALPILDRVRRLTSGHSSCAVVGNGPYGGDLSSEVDAAFVMRCNAFKLGFPGIGERIDLNISSLYHRVVPVRRVGHVILGVFPTSPSLFRRYTTLHDMHLDWVASRDRLVKLGNEVWTYSEADSFSDVFRQSCASLDAFPTVGLMGIALARRLGFERIVLTGFTFFRTGQAHYFAEDEVAFPPGYHHRPDRERELVKGWVEGDHGVSYVLDPLLASALEA
jgi:hypothetical protein